MAETCFLSVSDTFESARHLPELAQLHPEARRHGHSFRVSCRLPARPGSGEFAGAELDTASQHLRDLTQAITYQDLNALFESPSNTHLAAWFYEKLRALEPQALELASTFDQGVVLQPSADKAAQAYAWRRFSFQAAHRLPHVPAGHKCGNMHGHGFEVVLHVALPGHGNSHSALELSATNEAIDAAWEPLRQQLHYGCLNDIPGLENPTSEQISCWLWSRLVQVLPGLHLVTVYENASCGSIFDGDQVRIWKELTMDSALSLKHAPQGDGRRRLHGHTYVLRLHLAGPLDEVLGWTVDFGDVKDLFQPIFKRFDHKPLHEIEGLNDCDAVSLAKWLQAESSGLLPALNRIDLYPTRQQGVVLNWGSKAPAVSV